MAVARFPYPRCELDDSFAANRCALPELIANSPLLFPGVAILATARLRLFWRLFPTSPKVHRPQTSPPAGMRASTP
jgi:hypothetical protein